MNTERSRIVAFAGWSLAAARATASTVDLDAIAGLLAAFERTRGEPRTFTPQDETPYRRPPSEESPEDPAIGRWAAVVLEEDFEPARNALRRLIARRVVQGYALPLGPGLVGAPGLIVMRRPASSSLDRWRRSLHEATAGTLPHYLLLVGGPRRFPFEVQVTLDEVHATGRLDAGEDASGAPLWEAYRAWADKVVRYEEGRMPVEPHALLYSFATDASTRRSHDELVRPLDAYLSGPGRQNRSRPDAPHRLFDRDATTARLCETLASSRPALLITASHGLECFDTPDERNSWGALTDATFVGKNGTPLDAAHVPSGPFGPGAVALSFACFSAGVPAESAHRALVDGVLGPVPGAPFTSPLPQALLAHPEGPVAFVGHVDRATKSPRSILEQHHATR